jgi:uncharacterized phiE125 gp8 family phage protein
MYSEKLTAPAEDVVVTLEEFKDWAGVFYSTEEQNARIESLLAVVTSLVEDELHRALLTQSWQMNLERFPFVCNEIVLNRPPLQEDSVEITYFDEDNAQQTWDAANYFVDAVSEPGRVVLAPTKRWPVTYCRPDAVQITFDCGFEEVPKGIKTAILFWTKILFDNPDPLTEKDLKAVPRTLDALLQKFRVHVMPQEEKKTRVPYVLPTVY